METLYTIWGSLAGLAALAVVVAVLMVKRADRTSPEHHTGDH